MSQVTHGDKCRTTCLKSLIRNTRFQTLPKIDKSRISSLKGPKKVVESLGDNFMVAWSVQSGKPSDEFQLSSHQVVILLAR